jgi:hypothetical protein
VYNYRSCYVNFAGHLLNAYNPNVLHPGLRYRWSDTDWGRFVDMIADFGYNVFEFWLEPQFFCRAGLESDYGRELGRQMQRVIDQGHRRGVAVKMLAALSTVGLDWHTHCPNDPVEWHEVQMLWGEWLRRFEGLGVIGIFPGDPGGCSRNGCTAETFIDKSLELAELIQRLQPGAILELGTWGSPFFGWGNIQGPAGWRGEFIQSIQGTAWKFDAARAERAMRHLLKRLPDFPSTTQVAINLGFNPDGDPDVPERAQDARPWAREIAKTNRIVTWDFSLTEGENAIFPHYRFSRLYSQRRREQEAAPYDGGICFTMTPRLNQLSLYQAAQSMIAPERDPATVTRGFYTKLWGERAGELAEVLPVFEVYQDWGNHEKIKISKPDFYQAMLRGVEILKNCSATSPTDMPFFPDAETYRQELIFFFQIFRDLSTPRADFDALRSVYWKRVYAIYDHLPDHVDPRPKANTDRLIDFFRRPDWEESS